jgi:hypothetical protein
VRQKWYVKGEIWDTDESTSGKKESS